MLEIDDAFLNIKIIDRKKDLIKLQHGEYVSLSKVESEMKTLSLVDNVCVYADPAKTFPVAIVTAKPNHLKAIALSSEIMYQSCIGACRVPNESIFTDQVHESCFEDLCLNPIVEKVSLAEIQTHLRKCGRLAKYEIPQAIRLVPEMWTPDTGLVTAALKLKRKSIQDRYHHLIHQMYFK